MRRKTAVLFLVSALALFACGAGEDAEEVAAAARTTTSSSSSTTTSTSTTSTTSAPTTTRAPVTTPPRRAAPVTEAAPTSARSDCSPAYPTVCIPPAPPDLDCPEVPYEDFTVLPPDPHGFDRDRDGAGCET